MTSPMKLLNVKVPQELRDLIEQAVAVSGAPNQSDWVREALEAGARVELQQHQAQLASTPTDDGSPTQPPSRSATLGVHRDPNGRVQTSGCVHPPTAHRNTVEAVVCGLCQVVIRWR